MSAADGPGNADGGFAAGGGGALRAALDKLAATPRLLVATDFDGVVAPLVDDPSASAPLPGSAAALTALAGLPSTDVLLVSGRDRATLQRLAGLVGVTYVGSHGVEFEDGLAGGLSPAAGALLDRVVTTLTPLVAAVPGARLEVKPFSAAVHVRNAGAAGPGLVRTVAEGPAAWSGVEATHGKDVLELAVLRTSKGSALDTVRDRLGSTAVVFSGDDVTDEKAFAVLGPDDVGIKVGPGDTAARYRVDAPEDMTAVFEYLLAARA